MATKYALVTGSSSGIGLGMAKGLASRGYSIIMTGSRTQNEAEGAINDVRSTGNTAVHYCQANLKQGDGMERLCKEVDELSPNGIDILVNNAGMQHVTLVEDCSVEKWNEMLAINLTAPFFLIKHFVPRMKEKGWGRIINISSRMGVTAAAKKSPYCTVKHGLIGMTKAVALEVAPYGITCNAICPGWVDTPFVSSQVETFATQQGISLEEAKKKVMCDSQPTGNDVKVTELADLALFLCSPGGNSMTGAALVVDGGMSAGSK